MIQHRKWKPDTCDCILQWQEDDEHPEIPSVYTEIRTCEHHIGLFGLELHKIILAENHLKNRFESIFTSGNIPDAFENVLISVPITTILQRITDAINNRQSIDESLFIDLARLQFKLGLEYKWSFDEERNLVIDVRNFPATTRNIIIEKAQDVKFKGKIRIIAESLISGPIEIIL